jgi:hypothetical protein
MWHEWGERRGAYRVLVGKPDGKRPLERLGRNGRDIIKWIFKKVHRCGLD